MEGEQFTFPWAETPSPTASSDLLPDMLPLAERLKRLAKRGVFLGTSSWKYPGWLGKVYNPARYATRGRFSQKRFTETCLSEYAALFPTVCGDFAFYQFPSPEAWERTFAQLPQGFQFSLKVPEEVTVERFPDLPRYGRRAGTANEHFMDSALVCDQLLNRLEPYRDKLGVLIFEFGTIHGGPTSEPRAFAARLDGMLSGLPAQQFRFAVEVRNPEFLEPAGAYLDTLRAHGVAHCLNSWTRMPSLMEQIRIPGVFTAAHTVARLLLRPGRTYQQAVEQFSPYERVQDPYPEGRDALRELIESYLPGENALYTFVNNRFEGNAIDTIQAATEAIR